MIRLQICERDKRGAEFGWWCTQDARALTRDGPRTTGGTHVSHLTRCARTRLQATELPPKARSCHVQRRREYPPFENNAVGAAEGAISNRAQRATPLLAPLQSTTMPSVPQRVLAFWSECHGGRGHGCRCNCCHKRRGRRMFGLKQCTSEVSCGKGSKHAPNAHA